MTSKKQLLDLHEKHEEEVAPALEEMLSETMRTDGPANAVAWAATVVGSFVVCLVLLVAVAGG